MTTALEVIDLVRHFSPHEWSDPSILSLIDADVLLGLAALRERHGKPIHPSRHPEGWVRHGGSTTSMHYVGDGRLGRAADFFPEGDVRDCWLHAIEDSRWGGFGLYLDTKRNARQPGPMMHLDLRPGPRVFWVRTATGRYVYKHERPNQFWRLFEEVR